MGSIDEGASDGDALLLAARQLRRPPAEVRRRDSDLLEHRGGAPLHRSAGEPGQLEWQPDVARPRTERETG